MKIVWILFFAAVSIGAQAQDMLSFLPPRHGKQRTLEELCDPGIGGRRVVYRNSVNRMVQNYEYDMTHVVGAVKKGAITQFTLDGITCRLDNMDAVQMEEILFKYAFIGNPRFSQRLDMDAATATGITDFARYQYGDDKTGDGWERFLGVRLRDLQNCDNCYQLSPDYVIWLASAYCANTGRIMSKPQNSLATAAPAPPVKDFIQTPTERESTVNNYYTYATSVVPPCEKHKTWMGRNWGWVVPVGMVVVTGIIYGLTHHEGDEGQKATPPPPTYYYGGPYTPPLVLKKRLVGDAAQPSINAGMTLGF